MKMKKKTKNEVVYVGENHKGKANASPYGISRLAPNILLIDSKAELDEASRSIVQVSNSKLEVIAKQINFLRRQAEQIIESARRDIDLHRAECRFSRKVGQIYHLYQKSNGDYQWSILSHEDWNFRPPHKYIGSYKLLPDQSWKDINNSEEDVEITVDFSELMLSENSEIKE